MKIAPNRIAVYLTAIAALATALVPVVANLDLTSMLGIVGALLGIVGVVRKWLDGWQLYEARVADPSAPAQTPVAR